MIAEILNVLSYSFMQRALFASLLIAIPSALLGFFIFMKKISMIGDGIAHISLLGIVLGIITKFNHIISAVTVSSVVTFLIEYLRMKKILRSDVSLAILFVFSLSLVGILIAKFKLYSTDLFGLFFGSILGIPEEDLVIMLVLSVISTITILLFRYYFFFIAYDEESAFASGINIKIYNYLFAILLGIVIAFSIKIAGVLLITALLIIPSLISSNISNKFDKGIILSVLISSFSCVIGVILAYLFDIPVGASITILLILALVISHFQQSLKVFFNKIHMLKVGG
ncbi:MAG: metal ABC transporter permease [Candidatus Aenigmatarchaeota archaeon]